MSEDITSVRKATPRDLPYILGILTKSGLPIEGVKDHIANFLIAECQGVIVGVCGLEVCGFIGLVRSVAVTKANRQRGVGRQLVEQLVRVAQRRGISELYLFTPSAQPFFGKLGFVRLENRTVPHSITLSYEYQEKCLTEADPMVLSLSDRGVS